MAHSVLAIANEFLARASAADGSLTPMHLQKLCYFAHGFNLALAHGKPLTADRVEAWEFGPVFPVLYDALKGYGARAIPEQIHINNWAKAESVRGPIVIESFEDDEQEIIEGVFDTYGDIEAFKLSALTHEPGSPWEKVYRPGQKNLVIPNSLIEEYFVELVGEPR